MSVKVFRIIVITESDNFVCWLRYEKIIDPYRLICLEVSFLKRPSLIFIIKTLYLGISLESFKVSIPNRY